MKGVNHALDNGDVVRQLKTDSRELRKALKRIVDAGGIGPEDMFHDARDILAETEKYQKEINNEN
jgi:hypothetical protein